MSVRAVKVGLLGLGTVGGGTAKLLLEQRERLARRLGAELVLTKAADLDLGLARELGLPADILTDDARQVLQDPDIDIVVELIGGLEPARGFVLEAISRGMQVASAN
jgi:homoserine dehydrogenase